MLAALRYRRAQAMVVAVLSAVVVTCLVLAPLYTRALEQALVKNLIRQATAPDLGLRLTSSSSTDPTLPLLPERLVDLIPDSVRSHLGPPIGSTSVTVRRMPLIGEPEGRLLARDGMCEQVRFTAGHCPSGARQVAVSADQAKSYAMAVGDTLVAGEWDASVSRPEATPRTSLLVVGVYQPVDGPYWFGDQPTGHAVNRLGFDTMLTPVQTFLDDVTSPGDEPTPWLEPHYAADLPLLANTVGIDEIGSLGATVGRLVEYPLGAERAGTEVADTVTVRSRLPAIADEVAVGSAQASVTIPLLMAQLGLLLGCVLWLVLVAAADQRRGEVAVARLRGRGSRGARRLLLAETLPPVILGAPLGALFAISVSSVARHTVLVADPPFEVPVAAVVALMAGLALMVALAVLSVRRVCREPVAALLRSVPPRRTDVRLGVLEAMLVAAAGVAFLALVTGSVGGPVGVVAPALLALAVGVVAARVLAAVLTAGGRVFLRRGHPNAGAALLTASRRGTTRWLVPVVTVAVCITVVTTDALAVGARNWAGRAAAEVGAVSVLTLDSVDLASVAKAVRAVDPTGALVTPVAVLRPDSRGSVTTVGVVPSAFRRIALWPGVDVDSLGWDRLTAPTVAPLVITGRQIRFHVQAPSYTAVSPDFAAAASSLAFALRVVHPDGTVGTLDLGELPAAGVEADRVAGIDCAKGCRVIGVGVLAPLSTGAINGNVTLSEVSVDGTGVNLGGEESWRDHALTDDVEVKGEVVDGALAVSYSTNGSDQAFLDHGSMPAVVPALTTAPVTPSGPGLTFAGAYVDGSTLLMRSAGSVAFAPGAPASASIVNIDNLLAQGWRGRGSAVLTAYVDSRDPVVLTRIRAALAERGIKVTSTSHADVAGAAYGRTAAAWSLQLALAVGLLSLLVAGVGIIVLASTSWRARSRDYAALRLAGQGRRGIALLAQLETGPVIVASAILGIAVGLWAAPAAIGQVPLFTSPPPTFPIDLVTAWVPSVVAGVVGLVVLSVVGVVTSHRVARRADLQRLRDGG